MNSVRSASIICFLLCLTPCTDDVLKAQESANFTLKRVTVSSIAEHSGSASFMNTVTGIDIGGSASVCPTGMAVTTGFWSVKGISSIPVILTAMVNEIEPQDVDLDWTGLGPTFSLYRSENPENIISPANLFGMLSECADTDSTAVISEGVVLFYKVEPDSGP